MPVDGKLHEMALAAMLMSGLGHNSVMADMNMTGNAGILSDCIFAGFRRTLAWPTVLSVWIQAPVRVCILNRDHVTESKYRSYDYEACHRNH